LDIGEAIPPELYEVVAEILLFVDGMEKVKAKLDSAAK
jgi:flagellar biosynthesis protein